MLGADPCAAFGRARTQGWLITAAGVRPILEDVSMLQVFASSLACPVRLRWITKFWASALCISKGGAGFGFVTSRRSYCRR